MSNGETFLVESLSSEFTQTKYITGNTSIYFI